MLTLEQSTLLLKLILAAVLGAVIGFERELGEKAAGFRTHALVCVGSALIMEVSMYVYRGLDGSFDGDPGRIAAQVVSGIGFLGAGTIIRGGAEVKGLTTAASLWAVAGIGLAVGAGMYFASISATFIILGILYGLGFVSRNFIAKRKTRKETS